MARPTKEQVKRDLQKFVDKLTYRQLLLAMRMVIDQCMHWHFIAKRENKFLEFHEAISVFQHKSGEERWELMELTWIEANEYIALALLEQYCRRQYGDSLPVKTTKELVYYLGSLLSKKYVNKKEIWTDFGLMSRIAEDEF